MDIFKVWRKMKNNMFLDGKIKKGFVRQLEEC